MIFLLGPLHWSYINFQHSENTEIYCSYVQIWVSPNHFICCRSVIFSLTIQRAHSGKLFSGWGAHYLQTLRLIHKQIVQRVTCFQKIMVSKVKNVIKWSRPVWSGAIQDILIFGRYEGTAIVKSDPHKTKIEPGITSRINFQILKILRLSGLQKLKCCKRKCAS